jgi:hypothetical protein
VVWSIVQLKSTGGLERLSVCFRGHPVGAEKEPMIDGSAL